MPTRLGPGGRERLGGLAGALFVGLLATQAAHPASEGAGGAGGGRDPWRTRGASDETPPVGSPLASRPALWSEADEKRVEALLDRYFAAPDDTARASVLQALEGTPLRGRAETLRAMAEAGVDPKPWNPHLPIPWRQGTERGWYNLALPPDYSPKQAYPLILALHGMPSNADNLVSFYRQYFPKRGYIVLFPNTIHRASSWPAPDEKRDLVRLIQHVAGQYRIDYRRIYCTGASGGGIGTWHWLVTEPDLFAAGISFSAAGTIFDKRLARIAGTPFYVHHGTKDYIPIASTAESVKRARSLGAEIEFHVSEGTGHTPPKKDWTRAFDWLRTQPPNTVYARPLLEAPPGALPLGYPKHKPFQGPVDGAEYKRLIASLQGQAETWAIPDAIAPGRFVQRAAAVSRILSPKTPTAEIAASIQSEIDRIAEVVRGRFADGMAVEDKLYALNEVFFQVEGFTLDASDAPQLRPEGTVIASALERKRGNVWALTGIYCTVAHAVGVPVYPVVTPYHAFARYDDGTERINVEMAEAGASFPDEIYKTGYGLTSLDTTADLRGGSAANLLAAQVAALAGAARLAGDTEKAGALATLATTLDPDSLSALALQARLALARKDDKAARDAAARAATAHPKYGEGHYLHGLAQSASESKSATRGAARAFQAALEAPIKPLGAEAAFLAECHYRAALLYADTARAVRAKGRGSRSQVKTMKACMDHLVAALRANPNHPGVRKLFQELGGGICRRTPGM